MHPQKTLTHSAPGEKSLCIFLSQSPSPPHLTSSESPSRCHPLFSSTSSGRSVVGHSFFSPVLCFRCLCLVVVCAARLLVSSFVTSQENLFLRMNSFPRFFFAVLSLAHRLRGRMRGSAASCTPFTRVATHHRTHERNQMKGHTQSEDEGKNSLIFRLHIRSGRFFLSL